MSKHTKNVLTSVLSTIVFFGVLEITARIWFPEFRGQIHSPEQTLGTNYFLSKSALGRIPHPDYLPDLSKPIVLILGDSISHGYGQAYEDIYWVRLRRLMQLAHGTVAPEFISLSYYGNNLYDSINELKRLLQTHKELTVSEVIYQFNFNDIVPEVYGRARLHDGSLAEANTLSKVKSSTDEARVSAVGSASATTSEVEFNLSSSDWFKTLSRWRAQYLNYSTLLRASQHYVGTLVRKTSGSCEDRGLDALGPYTWTFGNRKYAQESEMLWKGFTESFTQLKAMADAKQIKLSIVISPLLFDIDTDGIHPYYNYLNYDFSCGTIDPRARLAALAKNLSVNLYDPTSFIKSSFDARIKEKNFTPFFFTADENHITPVASWLMADYLYVSRQQKAN